MIRKRKVDGRVLVETVLFDEAVNGKEVVVNTETYNQRRIDFEVGKANDAKDALDALDIEVEKAKEDAKLAVLADIQTVMDS
jgi:hypothetical protein